MLQGRRMRWAEHVARMGEMINACKILIGKPEGNTELGYVDIGGRIILKRILNRFEDVDWIYLAWDGI
jgi:hypothetical protein